MEARQFHRLANLSDPDFFEMVAEGLQLIAEHVSVLSDAVRALDGRSAALLSSIAEEEAGKYLLLLDAVRMPRTNQAARVGHLRRASSHLPKHLYARACEASPADLGELERYLALFRPKYYLDGPNDFDWIFRNEIDQAREGAIYVDLVALDGRLEWWSPSSWELDRFDLPVRGERVVTSLTAIGVATPEGLAVTARVWRDFTPTPETTFDELSGRIAAFFSALIDEGVTPSISDHDAGVLVDSWQYPLYNSDLSMIQISRREVEAEQRQRQAAFWDEEYGPFD